MRQKIHKPTKNIYMVTICNNGSTLIPSKKVMLLIHKTRPHSFHLIMLDSNEHFYYLVGTYTEYTSLIIYNRKYVNIVKISMEEAIVRKWDASWGQTDGKQRIWGSGGRNSSHQTIRGEPKEFEIQVNSFTKLDKIFLKHEILIQEAFSYLICLVEFYYYDTRGKWGSFK